jgi:hypothetical protein
MLMKITDEILNKYLDGELNVEESEFVKSELQSSEELRKKFNTLKYVHNELFNLNEDEASASFTNKVMSKIGHRKFTVPKQQKYFIFSIAAFITILCLVIIGFSISAIISTSSPVTDSLNVLETVSVLSGGFVDYIKQIVSGKGLSILGSIFSLVIIISGYFFFEMQKRAKANLGNGHHI